MSVDPKLIREAIEWTDAELTKAHGVNGAILHVLGVMSLQLEEMRKQTVFGMKGVNIRPFRLTTTPQKILEKDYEKRVRKVDIWVDSAVGQTTPTVRIGIGNVTSAVGLRIDAGDVANLGEFDYGTELFGVVSTGAINIYVVERL